MSLDKEKSTVQEQIESLTIHGVSRVVSAKNKYTRIIWLVLCISTAFSLSFTAVSSFKKYFEYEIINHMTMRQNSQMTLPGITFCHTNFYNPVAYSYEDPPAHQKLPENCSFNERKYFTNNMNWKIFQFACKMFMGTFKSKTSAMGAEIPQYFRFPKGFEITPYKLPCINLNRNSTLVQKAEGEKYGLHIIMYNEFHNTPPASRSDEPLKENRNGIHIFVHDQKQLVPIGDGIIVPSGYHTHISVTKTIFKRLPHPYPSKCEKDWSDQNSIYPGKNTQQMCYASCGLKQLYRLCPGVMPEMKVFMRAPEFPMQADPSNHTYWNCIQNSLNRIEFQQCDCRLYCDDETYTTVVNRNTWPPNWQAPSFLQLINKMEGRNNSGLSANSIRNRLIKVSIYYENFRELVFEERPLFDLSTVAGNLGGQMGLFMGASLLSLAEIFALVVTYFTRTQSKRGKVTPQPTS